MTIKIRSNQFDYLKDHLKIERADLFEYLSTAKKSENVLYLDVPSDVASDIRDWAAEKLQISGFDFNYELTKEGEILEGLIDLFYE